MMNMTAYRRRGVARLKHWGVIAALALALASAGCEGVLEVSNEQEILDANLDNPAAVLPIMNGAIGDYALAYANAIDIVGLVGQELIHTGSFPTWREVEKGIMTRPSNTGDQVYNNTSRAIWVADTAAVRMKKFLTDADRRFEVATVLVWGGFAHFFLADNYCSATIKSGPAITPAKVYERARDQFTEALRIATNANRADVRNQALGGRARAKLMLGDFAGAREDAALVPQGFRMQALYGSNARENNAVATNTTTLIRREAGVNPRFYNDALYKADPRTAFRDRGDTAKGPDPTRKYVEQLKYPLRDSPIPVFTWQEARLIQAEADARLGSLTTAVTLINQVRAAANIAPVTGLTTSAAVLGQVYYERSAEMWLQAQSLNDARRFNVSAVLSVLRDRCFEIGQTEFDNNPNLRG